MNARIRGLIGLTVFLVVVIAVCALTPFVLMPSIGAAVALPVIEVPGEVVVKGGLFGVDLTNTIIGTFVTSALVLLFVGLAWRASKGWTNEVPGKFQALVEVVIETFYNFCAGIGGDRLRTAPLLWPIVGTIFIFLLTGNMMKLFPGVETVGKMHCAYAGFPGYPAIPGWTSNSYRLWVDTPLNAGEVQTAENEDICNEFFKDQANMRFDGNESRASINNRLEEAQVALNALLADFPEEPTEEQAKELEKAQKAVSYQQTRLDSYDLAQSSRAAIARIEAQIAELDGDDEAALAALEAQLAEAQNDLNAANTRLQYPTALLTLTEEQLNNNVMPYLFHITPFVRGPATDLSLTFALAIFSVIAIQVYGVYAQGPAYFEKFVNLSALGNVGKRPLGIIDFIVGLIEIISEIGKIVSLAFRLFGNLFAGGVALMAITFLAGIVIPGVILGLEIIIGLVQALVFAVLTLVFSVQAMDAHHGDDHDHEHGHEAH